MRGQLRACAGTTCSAIELMLLKSLARTSVIREKPDAEMRGAFFRLMVLSCHRLRERYVNLDFR